MLTMSISALTLACGVYLVRNKAHPKTSEFDFNFLIGHHMGSFSLALTLLSWDVQSWLRVSQKLHTIAQVSVGATIGSVFTVGWFFLWRGLVAEAFSGSLWFRVMVILVSVGCCLGFLVYVVRTWLADEDESL